MKLDLIKKLLAPQHLEYLTLNRELRILEVSANVARFAEFPEELAVGQDVCLAFPELIGSEDLLLAVLEGDMPTFEFKGIGRFPEAGSPLYMDFYVNLYTDDESQENYLIVFFQDVSDRMLLEQRLVQSSNETNLLLGALSTSRNYIRQLIQSMADALIVTTINGIIKSVNPAAQKLFGYEDKDDLIGKSISKLIQDQNFLNFVSQKEIVLDGEFLKNIEVVCRTKTDEKLVVAFSCSVVQTDIELRQETTAVSHDIAYIGRDITERQRTQQRLGTQYATARVLSESVSLHQAIPKILQAICESLGWTLGELWMPEEYPNSQQLKVELNSDSAMVKVLRCVEIWSRPSAVSAAYIQTSQQIRLSPALGWMGRIWAGHSPRWVADVAKDPDFVRCQLAAQEGLHGAFAFPIVSDGEVLGVMAFFSQEVQPIDEELLQTMTAIGSQIGQFIKRKRAESALAESEERYRDLFENATDLIQSVAADGEFIYVNRAWKETLGYSEAELGKMTVYDIIHPEEKVHFLEIYQRVMLGEKFDHVQTVFSSKDGRKICLEGSLNCKFVAGVPVATRAIFRDITERLLAEAALAHEREQTERLLLNILPEPIADRLKRQHSTIAENFADVTVLFADIVGFTQIASYLSPIDLVNLLNQIFSAFDQITENYGLEKIKTIGDAYMVVGGLPTRREDHAEAIAEMALDMQRALNKFNEKNNQAFSIRTGIHSGPVVAGVIGLKKFIYDLWGDTVNTASRMESHGMAGRIHVSESTYNLLKDNYLFEKRGAIQVKGKGEMNTYFLLGRKTEVGLYVPPKQVLEYSRTVREATQRLVGKINDKLRDF